MSEKSIKGFCLWLFWTVFYSVRPRERDMDKWLKRTQRTWWSWKRFKPYVWCNEGGTRWNVYLSDGSYCTKMRTITVPVHISDETGKIIGLNLSDYVLSEATKPVGGGDAN